MRGSRSEMDGSRSEMDGSRSESLAPSDIPKSRQPVIDRNVVQLLLPQSCTLKIFLASRNINHAIYNALNVEQHQVLEKLCSETFICGQSDRFRPAASGQVGSSIEVSRASTSVSTQLHSSSTSVQEVINQLIANDVRSMQLHHHGAAGTTAALTSQFNQPPIQNILSLGYRLKRWQSELGMRSNTDIECFYVNTLHSLYFASSWTILLKCIGPDEFLNILSLPMFQSIGRGSFIQISGIPISRLLYGMSDGKGTRTVDRHSKLAVPQGPKQKYTIAFLGSTVLPRHRMFYHIRKRPLLKEIVGLPSSHWLRTRKVGGAIILPLLKGCDLSTLSESQLLCIEQFSLSLQERYSQCNILRALNIFCPLQNNHSPSEPLVEVDQTSTSDQPNGALHVEESSLEGEVVVARKRKRRERGCRAGKHVKARLTAVTSSRSNDMHLIASTKDEGPLKGDSSPIGTTVQEGFSSRNNNKKGPRRSAVTKLQVKPSTKKRRRIIISSPAAPTVGERIVRRILKTTRAGLELLAAGIHSQMEDSECIADRSAISLVDSRSSFPSDSYNKRKHDEMTREYSSGGGKSIASMKSEGSAVQEINILDRQFLTEYSASASSAELSANMNPTKGFYDAYVPKASFNNERENKKVNVAGCQNFCDLATGVDSVSTFLRTICSHIFSRQLVWGTRKNKSVFLSGIDRYVRLGKSESISLTQLCNGISPNTLPWIVDFCVDKIHGGDSFDLKTQLLFNFIHWIYVDVVNPLLKSCFYITEGEHMGNEALFFRHPLWNSLVELGKKQIKQNFVQVYPSRSGFSMSLSHIPFYDSKVAAKTATSIQSASNKRQKSDQNTAAGVFKQSSERVLVAPSQLRFIPSIRLVPKKRSMRPITNLRSYSMGARGKETAVNDNAAAVTDGSNNTPAPYLVNNSSLYNCLHVLRDIHSRNPKLCGFGSLGLDDVYTKLREYKETILVSQIESGEAEEKFEVGGENSQSENDDVLCEQGIRPDLKLLRIPSSLSNSNRSEKMSQIKFSSDIYKGIDKVPFYIATVDLDKCYDSVDTVQLYGVIKNIVRNKASLEKNHSVESDSSDDDDASNLVHKYSVSHYMTSLEKAVTRSIRKVTKGNDLIPFSAAATNIAESHKGCVITDGVIYTSLHREKLLRLLKMHLFSHLVRIKNTDCTVFDDDIDVNYFTKSKEGLHTTIPTLPYSAEHNQTNSGSIKTVVSSKEERIQRELTAYSYFTQIRGIPQGSVLSPILCNLYYGHVENKEFGSLEERLKLGLEDNKSVIIRMMDDYIMISTDEEAARHFLQHAHTVLHNYGGGVNGSKTRANFDVTIETEGERVTIPRISERNMIWCGFSIDTVTLEVQPSFDRLIERPISSSVNVGSCRPGNLLRQAMKSFVRPKCHMIVLDPFINSPEVVISSVCKIFLMAALRSFSFIRGMNAKSIQSNPRFIYRSVCESVLYGARLIRSRSVKTLNLCKNSCSSDAFSSKHLFSLAMLIGYMSFTAVFECKHGIHAVVVRLLKAQQLLFERNKYGHDNILYKVVSRIFIDCRSVIGKSSW